MRVSGPPEPNTATELAQPWCVALTLRHWCRRVVLGYHYCGIVAIRASAFRDFAMLCEALQRRLTPLLPLAIVERVAHRFRAL